MKVALLTDGIYPFHMGGMQKHSFYLAQHLAELGVEIDLYVPQPPDDRKDIRLEDYLTLAQHRHIHLIEVHFPQMARLPGHYLVESFAFARNITQAFLERGGKLDFIYAKGFTAWHLLRHRKEKLVDLPPVGVNLHGYEMYQIPPSCRVSWEYRLLRPVVKQQLDLADYLFSYGGKITELIQAQGVAARRILEVPTGIGEEWVRRSEPITNRETPRKFVFLGRYERRKGIQELLRCAQKIGQNHEFFLELVGPIPPGVVPKSDHIKLRGPVWDTQVMQERLDEAEVLVCPSYSEGMPNVIMEAMARGCAVIASDVGAVSQQVDSTNGWLIPPANSEALSQALIQALETEPEDLRRMRNISVEKVKSQFLWQHIARRTLSVIQGCTESVEEKSGL